MIGPPPNGGHRTPRGAILAHLNPIRFGPRERRVAVAIIVLGAINLALSLVTVLRF